LKHLLIILFFSTCTSPSTITEKSEQTITHAPKNIKPTESYLETYPRYKYDQKLLLENLFTSISFESNLKKGDLEINNTRGIYVLHVDSTGEVCDVTVQMSFMEHVDKQIISFCDTLSFYPAIINGEVKASKFILPLKICLSDW